MSYITVGRAKGKEMDWFLNLAGIVNNRKIKFHEITKHVLLVAFRDYTSGVILY